MNLSIGVYYDDAGKLPVMRAVRQAEEASCSRSAPSLPAHGGALNYRQGVQKLLFGAQHEAVTSGRIATIQSIGGSGALRVGGDFLKRLLRRLGRVRVRPHLGQPPPLHLRILRLRDAHLPVLRCGDGGVNFDGMLTELSRPRPSPSCCCACCHNPTGVDLSPRNGRS